MNAYAGHIIDVKRCNTGNRFDSVFHTRRTTDAMPFRG